MRSIHVAGAAIVLVVLLLPGCKTIEESTAVDTFCITSKKRSWSINDSPESIRQAEIWNGTIDRRCGVRKKSV